MDKVTAVTFTGGDVGPPGAQRSAAAAAAAAVTVTVTSAGSQ